MEKQTTFTAKGFVFGNFWGGGEGAYPTIKLSANTREELLEKANGALKDGSLDSGMGFQSLKGAVLEIKETTTIEVDGKHFFNHDYEEDFIGELDLDEQGFLISCLYGS